ncbi:MAG: thioredoxin family protein [Kiritimatiellae bacterium]|nr:thioredoxin family protein [Kiritimatiellia bacterium]
MKKLIALLTLLPMATLAKTSTPQGFTDNLTEAFQEAKASGKFVYVCFSGSDWCGWCRRLDKEVFEKETFLSAVTNDYILVFIDSPRDQSLLSERAREENPKLVERYSIRGFPTALVFDETGLKIATTGYQKGGAKKYAKMLLKMRNNKDELKKEAEIEEKFIVPFEKRMERISRDFGDKMNEYVEAQKAKGRIESDIENDFFKEDVTLFGDMLAALRAEIERFEASVVPEEAEELRKEKAEEAKEILDNMEMFYKRKKANAKINHNVSIEETK